MLTGLEIHSRLCAPRGQSDLPVPVQTVRNRIHSGGFKAKVPATKPDLSQCHKDARMSFSRAYNACWNNGQGVMFSDE